MTAPTVWEPSSASWQYVDPYYNPLSAASSGSQPRLPQQPTSPSSTRATLPKSAHDTQHRGRAQDSSEERSLGTLVIGQHGRSKYLGPNAASEWLKDVSGRP